MSTTVLLYFADTLQSLEVTVRDGQVPRTKAIWLFSLDFRHCQLWSFVTVSPERVVELSHDGLSTLFR